MTRRRRLVAAWVLILLVATACTTSLAGGGSGSIAMVPFTSEELRIRGVVPLVCRHTYPGNFECEGLTPDQRPAAIVQQSLPGTRIELVALLLDQVGLEQLPESTGSYKGVAFTWDLYTFETQIKDAGPETFRVDSALAEGDSASYVVALVTLPDVYDANAALYETAFTHVAYALAPLE
ncbi:MAG: hypothetical protein JSV36_18990 [Anaerolineae bacterium]|nr:MAG: hypothetical protein JSV36_18990 [Anaerolineae bacterium]